MGETDLLGAVVLGLQLGDLLGGIVGDELGDNVVVLFGDNVGEMFDWGCRSLAT